MTYRHAEKIKRVRDKISEPREVPRSCATCEYMADDGLCTEYNSRPPLEYVTQENDCYKWIMFIPF